MRKLNYKQFVANKSERETLNVLMGLGRIRQEEAAEILGFEPYHIPVLIQHGLLEPLADPKQNSHKFFAAVQIVELAKNPKWLEEATRVTYQLWKEKNANRRKTESDDSEQAIAA